MKNNKGLLVVLSGPSGSGKDTVLKKVLEKCASDKENSCVKLSISATTRTPRDNEIHGKDYYFLSKEEFEELINNDGMIEYAEYCGNFYGTPKKAVNDWLEQGFDVILEIEVQGALNVMKASKDCISIFILPPSLEELRTRLVKRNTDNETVVEKRLHVAKDEIKHAINYDYIVINDQLEKCTNDIFDIINVEKMKSFRIKNVIEKVMLNV